MTAGSGLLYYNDNIESDDNDGGTPTRRATYGQSDEYYT